MYIQRKGGKSDSRKNQIQVVLGLNCFGQITSVSRLEITSRFISNPEFTTRYNSAEIDQLSLDVIKLLYISRIRISGFQSRLLVLVSTDISEQVFMQITPNPYYASR